MAQETAASTPHNRVMQHKHIHAFCNHMNPHDRHTPQQEEVVVVQILQEEVVVLMDRELVVVVILRLQVVVVAVRLQQVVVLMYREMVVVMLLGI